MQIVNFFQVLKAKYLKYKHYKQYIYGSCIRYEAEEMERIFPNVRYNRKTKRCEFVLWKAGQQGHVEDYWHPMGPGWEVFFIPNETKEVK